MLILKLIALLIGAFVLFLIMDRFNRFSRDEIGYEYFTHEHTIAMVIGYALILVGRVWSIGSTNDPLNGIIVMLVGIAIIAMVIKNNFNKTPRLYAIAGSLMQIVIYIPVTFLIIPIAIMLFGFLSQIKPVYTINARD